MDIFVIILIAIYVKFKTRVMRKSLLYVFAVICTMGFFTACGDDDDSSLPVTGKICRKRTRVRALIW